jgi:hypothetical protein
MIMIQIVIVINKNKIFINNMKEYFKKIMNNISHIADILAIPFFALSVIYFYNIENKSNLEYLLLFWSVCGLVLDILFTHQFLYRKKM